MSKSTKFDKDFWDSRYIDHQTQWDAGSITQPLQSYFDQLTNKSIKLLIPGAGNAYEAEYLHHKGFSNVYVADISEIPLRNLKQRCPDFPNNHLLHENFFNLNQAFDIIIEQTFFCALHPSMRHSYVEKCADLLVESGRLVGVLFDLPLNDDRPPFGGNLMTYQRLFEVHFDFKHFSTCYNSIAPRAGNEIFINLIKK